MSYKIDLSKCAKTSFVNILTQVYDATVNLDGIKVIKKDKYWIYEGSIDFGKFIVIQNEETGFVERIELPKACIIAEFSNIKTIALEE